MKLIVCYDIGEFRNYCNDNNLNPHDPHQVKWIRDRMDMLGFRGVEVIFYGTYYRLKEYHDIKQEAERMDAFNRKPPTPEAE